MEIRYCNQCHRRVSSVEIDAGKGMIVENAVFCDDCARTMGLYKKEEKKAPTGTGVTRRFSSSGSRTQTSRGGSSATRRSHHQTRRTQIVRIPQPGSSSTRKRLSSRSSISGTHRAPGLHGDSQRVAAVKKKSGLTAAVIVLVVVILLLVGIVIMIQKQRSKRSSKASSVTERTGSIEQSDDRDESPLEREGKEDVSLMVPPKPGLNFPTGGAWKQMLNTGWESAWDPKKGNWKYKDGVLMSSWAGEEDYSTLKSLKQWNDYEIGITFFITEKTVFELRFNIYQWKIYDPGKGTWHTISWQFEGVDVVKAELDGKDILIHTPDNIEMILKQRPGGNEIKIEVCTKGSEEGLVGISEIAIRSIPRSTVKKEEPPSIKKEGPPSIPEHSDEKPGGKRVLTIQIASGSDDAEESKSGSVGITSSDLELVNDYKSKKLGQTIGVRFASVDIPRGTVIKNAYIQFTVDETDSEPTKLKIRGQAADNAPTFYDRRRNISSRERTKVLVMWEPKPWPTGGRSGPDQRTPNIASIIQEIVNRPGWSSGNALVLIITGTGKRTAASYNDGNRSHTTLHIEIGEDTGASIESVPPIEKPDPNINKASPEVRGEKIRRVYVGKKPWGIAITPDAQYVYVGLKEKRAVSVIRISDNKVIKTIQDVENAYDMEVTPDGRYVFVANGNDSLTIINTSDNTVEKKIKGGNTPYGVAISSDGKYAYISNRWGQSVSVIDISSWKILKTVPIDHKEVNGLAVTPDGRYIYVADKSKGIISVIQTSDHTVVKEINIGYGSRELEVSPDGKYVYVSKDYGGLFNVVQTSDNTVLKTIKLVDGKRYWGLAVTPDGSYVYVTNRTDGTVIVIRTSDYTIAETISVGKDPTKIAVTPDGKYVYVTNQEDDSVSVIQAREGEKGTPEIVKEEFQKEQSEKQKEKQKKEEKEAQKVEEAVSGEALKSVYTEDFEKRIPKGATGRLSKIIAIGEKSIEAVKARKNRDFEVKIVITLAEPVVISENTMIKFSYLVTNAGKMRYGFKGSNERGMVIDAGYLKLNFPKGKWNKVEVKALDLKTSRGREVPSGTSLKKLCFYAGFKNSETNAKLYIDNIEILN